jgi:hypothetical protein
MRRSAGIVTRSFSAAAIRPSPHTHAPVPPAVAINQPTLAYRRHHDIEAPRVDSTAFRQAWRVCSRLDSLLEAGRIDREAWDAVHTGRRWAETVTPLRQQRWDVRVDVSAVPVRHRHADPYNRSNEAARSGHRAGRAAGACLGSSAGAGCVLV